MTTEGGKTSMETMASMKAAKSLFARARIKSMRKFCRYIGCDSLSICS